MTLSVDEIRPYEPIIQMLLDIYARRTNLPVAFYRTSTKKFIWSNKGTYSPLCKILNPKLPIKTNKLCTDDHIKRCVEARAVPELCHAGLWNIALPIKVHNKVIAVLISGQRRLMNEQRESESVRKFERFLKTQKREDRQCVKEQFNKTIRIYQDKFDTHFLGSLIDIQKYLYSWLLKNKNDELIKRSKIHSLAHEFLLPIQAIIADAENLFNEVYEPELKELADGILQEVQKLALIAENMRSSLIEPIKPYSFASRGLHRCIKESVALFRKEANKKNVLIMDPIIHGHGKFPKIEMSYEYLKRAFMNIIHNAVKYSYEGSLNNKRYIEIIGKYYPDQFSIEVINYGIGITKGEIESGDIFKEGYRGDLSVDRNRTGSGLGLFEVKKIIDRHNGQIDIRSDPKTDNEFGPYKTTVKVFLPLKQEKI